MKKCELRYATREGWIQFYGEPPARTVRAVVGVKDGEIIGIGGIVFEEPFPRIFMELTDCARTMKREIITGSRMIMDWMKQNRQIVYAVAHDDRVAPVFLRHFGFKYQQTFSVGDVYIWRR